ncbi:flagellar hook-length control protein FliK [Enterovibrio norvegicus]|uniref:flagellar hook-length control protein FliK n=1 Tax=Enterovibrio norvegicus TaxID=188144 RepID=UPI0024B1B726|nr:flagellar hook-length control protein FliK [Enterovibrio norvegicus]
MKIDNNSNISALMLEVLKNKPVESVLLIGQENSKSIAKTGTNSSQLSQLLSLMNIFPLLTRSTGTQNAPSVPLTMLLNSLFMPSKPDVAANWLAERQTDKSTLDALRLLSTADNESSSRLKAMLMLFAEQRFQDSNKPGEFTWLFPFHPEQQTPVHVTVKKTRAKTKKSRWSITVNLTLSKNRQVLATVELEDQELSLAFSTNSKGLKKRVEAALPVLEKQLSKHQLHLSNIKVEATEPSAPATVSSGVNIQV